MKYVAGVVVCALVGSLSAWGVLSHRQQPTLAPEPVTESASVQPPAPQIQFQDLAQTAGIHFQHQTSRTPMHYVPEIMGGGAAWLDYDQDGYYDLFLVQGGKFPPDANEQRTGPSSRLFRNLGDGTFADVTEQVGIWHRSFGQGVAAGDYDND